MSLLNEEKKESYNTRVARKRRECAQRLVEIIKANNIVLSPEDQEKADYLTRDNNVGRPSTFGKPLFFRIFGDKPELKQSVPSLEIFDRLGKGAAEMRGLMRKWKDTLHVNVSYDVDKKSYTIVSVDEGYVLPVSQN